VEKKTEKVPLRISKGAPLGKWGFLGKAAWRPRCGAFFPVAIFGLALGDQTMGPGPTFEWFLDALRSLEKTNHLRITVPSVPPVIRALIMWRIKRLLVLISSA